MSLVVLSVRLRRTKDRDVLHGQPVSSIISRRLSYFFSQTPQVPPLLQCLQERQFLQALQDFAPVHVANSELPQQLSAVT